MRLGEYRGRYKALDKRNKILAGVALILVLVGVGALAGGQWRGDWTEDIFTLLASKKNTQSKIYELIEYDGDIYGGTGNSGYLFSYTPGDSGWTQVAQQLSPAYHITSLLEYNGVIYGGTSGGYLYSYTPGVSSGWTNLTPTGTYEDYIRALVEYDGTIYGGTDRRGRLYSYTPGVSTEWTLVANTLNDQDRIESLIVYDGVIYGGTSPQGRLFSYTPGDSGWTQVADRYGTSIMIQDLQELDGTIYASSGQYLLAYTPGVSTEWTAISTTAPSILDLAVRAGVIYGTTYDTPKGQLVSYTPGDSGWALVADSANTDDPLISTLIVGDIVYAGSGSLGSLYGYQLPALSDPGLDTGGLLTIGSFWYVPSTPKVNETITWKITGVGITRAAIKFSVEDALTGVITVNTENLMYSNGLWWTTSVYTNPCRVIATPYVYSDTDTVNGTSIVLDVSPQTNTASPPEVVSHLVEKTVNTTVEASKIATRFMISTTEWNGVEIPMWIPSLMLLVIVVLIVRRQQQ